MKKLIIIIMLSLPMHTAYAMDLDADMDTLFFGAPKIGFSLEYSPIPAAFNSTSPLHFSSSILNTNNNRQTLSHNNDNDDDDSNSYSAKRQKFNSIALNNNNNDDDDDAEDKSNANHDTHNRVLQSATSAAVQLLHSNLNAGDQPHNPLPFLPVGPNNQFICALCGDTFPRQPEFTIHLEIHAGKRPFACHICKYAAKTKGTLNVHVAQTHTEERPFKCTQCVFDTKTESRLQTHMLTHGEPSHPCAHSGCSHSAFTSAALKKHMIVHSEERPFVCQRCDYRTNRNGDLTIHVNRTHSKNRPFKCTQCNFDTKTESILKKHILTHRERSHHCTHSGCAYSALTRAALKDHISRRHKDILPSQSNHNNQSEEQVN